MLHANALNPASCARFAESVVDKFFGSFSSPFRSAPLHRLSALSPSLARLHRGPGVVPPEGNLHWPPCFAVFFRLKGERPKPNSRAQKKDYENEYKQKSEIRTQEPSRTVEHGRTDQKLIWPCAGQTGIWKPKNCWRCSAAKRRTSLNCRSGWQMGLDSVCRQTAARVTRVLAELGFHWNNTRQAWQHPCGTIPVEAGDV